MGVELEGVQLFTIFGGLNGGCYTSLNWPRRGFIAIRESALFTVVFLRQVPLTALD